MDAAYTYDHPLTTLPSDDRSDLGIFYPIMGHMCHMPVVEVDAGTGQVSFLDYVAVHDCGTLVNRHHQGKAVPRRGPYAGSEPR
jgi:CO/xanthine dehydrogenase Mo-binding subunit